MVFDSLLLIGMVFETWAITIFLLSMGQGESGNYASGMGNFSMLRMFRLVKLLRMARMARLLRMIPELVVIVKSIGVAFRSVSFFLMLLVIVLYVFAVFFRQITKDSTIGKEYFKSVLWSMNQLLLDGVLPIYAPLVRELVDSNALYWPVVMIFILLASVTIMNMLVGVLVEVVRSVAEREREAMTVLHVTSELRAVMCELVEKRRTSEMQLANQGSSLGRLRSRMSFSQSTTRSTSIFPRMKGIGSEKRSKSDLEKYDGVEIPDISKETFESFLSDPSVVGILRDCGVDAIGVLDSMDAIYEEKVRNDGQKLRFIDFVDVILNMRGTNPATVKDIKEQMRLIKTQVQENHTASSTSFAKRIDKLQAELVAHLQDLRRHMSSEDGSEDGSLMGSMAGFETFGAMGSVGSTRADSIRRSSQFSAPPGMSPSRTQLDDDNSDGGLPPWSDVDDEGLSDESP